MATWEAEESDHPEGPERGEKGDGDTDMGDGTTLSINPPEETPTDLRSILEIRLTGLQNKLDMGGEGAGGVWSRYKQESFIIDFSPNTVHRVHMGS